MCSFDARSKGQSGDSLERKGVMMRKNKQKTFVGHVQ
jgi:hypothetical protein